MHLDALAIAGLFDPFTKLFCVGYHDGNVFVVGTSVAGVVMKITVNGLCADDIVPVVKNTVEGLGGNCKQVGLS